jgi:hypothetical protein
MRKDLLERMTARIVMVKTKLGEEEEERRKGQGDAIGRHY